MAGAGEDLVFYTMKRGWCLCGISLSLSKNPMWYDVYAMAVICIYTYMFIYCVFL